MIYTSKLTIKEASKLLAQKKIKAKELTQAFLDRVKKLNKKLNAFITVCEDEALTQAEKIDNIITSNQKINNLAGIPFGAKDLFSTRDIKTTAGSKVLEDYLPVYDATSISKLKEAGAIVVGKTNLDAWGHGSSGENSDFGATKNPYDQTSFPGGSSSG